MYAFHSFYQTVLHLKTFSPVVDIAADNVEISPPESSNKKTIIPTICHLRDDASSSPSSERRRGRTREVTAVPKTNATDDVNYGFVFVAPATIAASSPTVKIELQDETQVVMQITTTNDIQDNGNVIDDDNDSDHQADNDNDINTAEDATTSVFTLTATAAHKLQVSKRRKQSEADDRLIARYMRMSCSLCAMPFLSFSHARNHYERDHSASVHLKCDNCDLRCRSKALALEHCHWHENPRQFE